MTILSMLIERMQLF